MVYCFHTNRMTMSLEQDIHQEKFENEYQKVSVNVLFTGGWVYNSNVARLKPFGITPEQFNVLRILRGSHPNALMLADITGRMIDKNSNATRLVEKLRLKGFVKRDICENNRRQVDIVITSRGLDLLSKIDKESDAWFASLKNITRSEAIELNRLLDKLRG
jgi:DNA-binding MarR family transcriptional regulator